MFVSVERSRVPKNEGLEQLFVSQPTKTLCIYAKPHAQAMQLLKLILLSVLDRSTTCMLLSEVVFLLEGLLVFFVNNR